MPSDLRAEILSIAGGMGRAHCCAEAAKLMEKNQLGVSANPVSVGS